MKGSTVIRPVNSKCKAPRCREPALPYKAFCSPECGAIIGLALLAKQKRKEDKKRSLAAKAEKASDRAKREALKTRSDWMRLAQKLVNEWCRWRDRGQPCISCGTFSAGAWHAGHFYSTAARPDLRLDPSNIHLQCAQCNMFLSGNLIEYRRNLPARIGEAELARLDGPPTAPRATVEVLKAVIEDFKARIKAEKEVRFGGPGSGQG